jgi:hypothetical protein
LRRYSESREISPSTVRRHAAAGRITLYRLGPKLLFVDAAQADAALFHRVPTGVSRAPSGPAGIARP